jgi:hypothetical protein
MAPSPVQILYGTRPWTQDKTLNYRECTKRCVLFHFVFVSTVVSHTKFVLGLEPLLLNSGVVNYEV